MNCKLICRFNLVFFAFVLLILSPVCYASSNIKQTEYKPFTPSFYNDYEKKDNIYMDRNKRIFSRKKKSRIAHVNELKLKVKKSNACLHLVKRGSYYSICPDETTNPLFVVIIGEKRYWLAKTTITGKHVKQIVKHIRKYADDSIHINTGTHGSRNGETIFSNDLPEGADLKGFYDVNLLLEDLDTIRKIPNVSIHSMSSYSGDIYPKEANLIGTNLIGAYLKYAKLIGANLYKASLEEATLIRAKLEGATLIQANLFRANLFRANLTGANLTSANLTGVCLKKAKLDNAKLPKNFKMNKEGFVV